KISPRSVCSVLQSLPAIVAYPAPPQDGEPSGNFWGSARHDSVGCELPQIFHGARDAFSRSRNHAFCSTPSMDGAGLSRRALGTLFARARDGRRGVALVVRAAAVEDLDDPRGEEVREIVAEELPRLGHVGRVG